MCIQHDILRCKQKNRIWYSCNMVMFTQSILLLLFTIPYASTMLSLFSGICSDIRVPHMLIYNDIDLMSCYSMSFYSYRYLTLSCHCLFLLYFVFFSVRNALFSLSLLPKAHVFIVYFVPNVLRQRRFCAG